jgi:hypothetical protein
MTNAALLTITRSAISAWGVTRCASGPHRAGSRAQRQSPPTPTSISAAGKLTRKQRAKLPAYFNGRRVSREIQTGDLERLGRGAGDASGRGAHRQYARREAAAPAKKRSPARIKACRSPRILHLATHGFFLADQRRDPNRELRGLGLLRRASRRWFWPNVRDAVGEDVGASRWRKPLLRSGAPLAGFKTWLSGGSLPAEAEDGLLTAEDVPGWICWRRSWRLCRLARRAPGEVRTGEGVFGLRRANAAGWGEDVGAKFVEGAGRADAGVDGRFLSAHPGGRAARRGYGGRRSWR